MSSAQGNDEDNHTGSDPVVNGVESHNAISHTQAEAAAQASAPDNDSDADYVTAPDEISGAAASHESVSDEDFVTAGDFPADPTGAAANRPMQIGMRLYVHDQDGNAHLVRPGENIRLDYHIYHGDEYMADDQEAEPPDAPAAAAAVAVPVPQQEFDEEEFVDAVEVREKITCG